MDSMLVPEKSQPAQGPDKLKRRPNKKTKTGCKTCRIRRVKCDEGKPKCRRCEIFGVECDGYYMDPKSKIAPPRPPPPAILPRNDADSEDVTIPQVAISTKLQISRLPSSPKEKPISQDSSQGIQENASKDGISSIGTFSLSYRFSLSEFSQQTQRPLANAAIPYSTSSLYQQPDLTLFRTQEEFQYFQYFTKNTGPNLTNNYTAELWDRLVLQACEREPSIFCAVVALGALDASIKRARSWIKPMNRVQQYKNDEHYRFSLNYYSTAVKQMRQAIEKGKHDLRTALISSILLIMFETYHGNHENAIDQVESSARLLESWTVKPERSRDDRVSSPEPGTVEDELIQAFDKFDVECIIFKDKASLEHHRTRKDERTAAVQNMPDSFGSIDEASVYGKLIARRGWHFLCMVWSYDGVTPRPDRNCNLFDRLKGNPTPLACAERNKYLQEVDRFYVVFTPLLNSVNIMNDKKEWLIAQCLHIFFIRLRIALENCFQLDEVSYDRFAPQFREILAISKSILDTVENSVFIPSSQVAQGLGLVAQKCRDPFTRREAIHLLKSMARREMFCDSVILGSICEWIMEVEEEGMVDSYVPEENRTRGSIIWPEPRRQGMGVSCLLPLKGGSPGEMMKMITLIKW